MATRANLDESDFFFDAKCIANLERIYLVHIGHRTDQKPLSKTIFGGGLSFLENKKTPVIYLGVFIILLTNFNQSF